MKRIGILCLAALFLLPVAAWAGSRDAQWRAVQEALDRGLPQTAIGILDEILPAAIAEEAWAEAVRALSLKIVQEGRIQGGAPEELVVRLQDALAESPEPMQPVLEGILGHWTWQYFQQNRWRFLQRTVTAEPPDEDISTWDLPRILAEIDRHFTRSLAAADTLAAIPIAAYDDLLERGTVPDSYRPSLYDFLAFEALAFYAAGEQAGAQPFDAFVLMADSPIFDPVEDFLAWHPEAPDPDAATVKAIVLYQDLLRRHGDDPDPDARLDADLGRLLFGKNAAVGPDRAARFRAALEYFVTQHEGHPIAARARYAWAESLHDEGDLVAAHTLAAETQSLYPKTLGGDWCFNLLGRIEQPALSLQTERVWNGAGPEIQVTYRNITQVHLRAYPLRFEDYAGPEYRLTPTRIWEALRGVEPLRTWDARLPATTDYASRAERLEAPTDLPRGLYAIVASVDPAFGEGDNQIASAVVWVSDLALIVRPHRKAPPIEGLVLAARSGEPRAGVTVTRWEQDSWQQPYVSRARVTTDADGRFVFPGRGADQARFILVAETEDDRLAGPDDLRFGQTASAGVSERTVFFTDRAIYRPGQTIRFKGLCVRTDPDGADYRVLADQAVTVVFRDANGQEITRQTFRSNDYGSFSGSVTAPRDRLPGAMSLRVVAGPGGGASVRVEAYRRPRFRVTLDAPVEAPRLQAEVTVPGRAAAYTGAAVGDAAVTWSVTRTAQWPRWCRRCPGPTGGSSAQIIGHGTARTAVDGSFAVSFRAQPDPTLPPENEPVFTYRIHTEVTDAAGETRTADRDLRVGYTALRAALDVADWQTAAQPVQVTVVTESLDGQGQVASGVLTVYELQRPARVPRPVLPPDPTGSDPADPDTWPLGEPVFQHPVETSALGQGFIDVPLAVGLYRAVFRTEDRSGSAVRAEHTVQVLDPHAGHGTVALPSVLAAPAWSVEPGETFTALWTSGYDRARAYVELEADGRVLAAWWTEPQRTQEPIALEVTEALRGGFTLRVTSVHDNRLHLHERIVDVPWTNKRLDIRWEHFRSLIDPGRAETWTAVITAPDARRAVAEMVAALYDASLDAFLPHDWIHAFSGFRRESARLRTVPTNRSQSFRVIHWFPGAPSQAAALVYRHYPDFIRYVALAWASAGGGRGRNSTDGDDDKGTESPEPEPAPVNLGDVAPRRLLDETAFFYPHLVSDQEGVVRISFTAPEALTEWRFLGFAHDRDLRSGSLTDTTVTAKDLMVQPNAPRFLREGDTLEFTVTVSNASAARQTGRIALHLIDARRETPRDAALGNSEPEQDFDVPAGQSRTVAWRLTVPDDMDPLRYRVVAATTRLSDGQEDILPVLSRRVPVTESLALSVRDPQTREVTFDRLLASGASDSLRHQSLSVQVTSQPAWYAVLALPYLMEQTRESSTATFTRLYANALAAHIANGDPAIRRVFDQWRGTDTLDSPLEKNADLKAVLIEESPWVRQAVKESEARRHVGILFDGNRMADELSRARFQLEQLQRPDGLWPWYPGGRGNEVVSLGIVTGFGRLRHLGLAEMDVTLAIKALGALDAWMQRLYEEIGEPARPEQDHLSSLVAYYLYGRSFFRTDAPVAAAYQAALDYWLDQARRHWLSQPRQSQAHLALALRRFGDRDTPAAILQSLKEFSVTDPELGMYWRDTERSWWWYRAPLETQALMIEAFDEVAADAEAVEACRVWLLQQKRTTHWATNRATADAIYALLLRGRDLLSSTALLEVALGGQWIESGDVEAGTGFYEARFVRGEITPELGRITLRKTDPGLSWLGVHWQYLEDIAKVTPAPGTPLSLSKTLYVKRFTDTGTILEPVAGPLAVGDELVSRIVLRVDRAMEYVHLKDPRGSGTEPIQVLSAYRWQDGLGYYETTRDTATHRYLPVLPPGVYVFESSVRVQHRGRYPSGVATVQCLYAPEFNSHSASTELVVE